MQSRYLSSFHQLLRSQLWRLRLLFLGELAIIEQANSISGVPMTEQPKLDEQKIDDAVLALLLLGLHGDKHVDRAWKSHDWDSLGRLHDAGYIHDPVGKSKSIVFTPEGLKRSEHLLNQLFGQSPVASVEPGNAG